MSKKEVTTVTAWACLVCDEAVYSRADGDMRYCSCGNVHMLSDGEVHVIDGKMYSREENVSIPKSRGTLKEDFESCRDIFGVLRRASKRVPELQSKG